MDPAVQEYVNPEGYRIDVSPELLQGATLGMLFSKVRSESAWIIPADQPMELLTFRSIFNALRKQEEEVWPPKMEPVSEELLPYEAFQRAFERVFYVLQDPMGFNGQAYDHNCDGHVSWQEFFSVYKRRRITVTLNMCERIFLTLENPDTSRLASFLSYSVLGAIVLSSMCFIVSTVPECHIDEDSCKIFKLMETCCLLLFCLEYCLRVCTCWAVRSEIFDKARFVELAVSYEPIRLPNPLGRLLAFVMAPSNLIDLAAILPGLVAMMVPNADGGVFVILRLVRLTRILRAFKSPTLMEPVIVMSRTIVKSTKALYVLAFNMLLGLVIFGSLMYMAEGGEELDAFGLGGQFDEELRVYNRTYGRRWVNGVWEDKLERSPFQSIPHTFWWAVVTATTVGYGDRRNHPTTTLGYLVCVCLMIFSLVILALPVGVIGGTFSSVWVQFGRERRAAEVAMQRDMKLITSEIARLDPWSLSRMMLIEVWHDHPGLSSDQFTRPPPAYFLGQAKIELRLDPCRPVTRVTEVKLEDRYDGYHRVVQGRITVKYEWKPDTVDSSAKSTKEAEKESGTRIVSDQESVVEDELRGTLQVSITHAKGLVNLNRTRDTGATNAFCVVLCYTQFLPQSMMPNACAWRTPTVYNSLNPRWTASHKFDYNWDKPDMCEEALLSTRRSSTMIGSPEDGPNRSSVAGADGAAYSSKLLQFVSLAKEVGSELKQQRADMQAAQEDVRALGSRVDQLAKSRLGPLVHFVS